MKYQNKNFITTLVMLFVACYALISQEISLTSLSQLEDPANSGKVILLNKSFSLNGQTLNIADGIILKPAGGILLVASVSADCS